MWSCSYCFAFIICYDSLIFLKAHEQNCNYLKDILAGYEKVSGQKVNFDKSVLFFSPTCADHMKSCIKQTLQISKVSFNEKYLGLPTLIGRINNSTFKAIKDRLWSKIQGRMEKLLLKVEKEVLIKVIS